MFALWARECRIIFVSMVGFSSRGLSKKAHCFILGSKEIRVSLYAAEVLPSTAGTRTVEMQVAFFANNVPASPHAPIFGFKLLPAYFTSPTHTFRISPAQSLKIQAVPPTHREMNEHDDVLSFYYCWGMRARAHELANDNSVLN